MGRAVKKCLWAIDLFSEVVGARQNTLSLLKTMADHFPIEIQPVFVLNFHRYNISFEYAFTVLKRHAQECRQYFQAEERTVYPPLWLSPQVLSQEDYSLKKDS